MNKICKILRTKKGLTLVELIVGMLVLALILATASFVLVPMMRFQSRANNLAEQNALLDNLANQITHDISMAIEPGPSPVTLTRLGPEILIIPIHANAGGPVTYTLTPEGIIYRQQVSEDYNIQLLPEEFHLRMARTGLRVESIALILETSSETIYTLTLTLENEDLTFEREYTVRPLALN